MGTQNTYQKRMKRMKKAQEAPQKPQEALKALPKEAQEARKRAEEAPRRAKKELENCLIQIRTERCPNEAIWKQICHSFWKVYLSSKLPNRSSVS